MSHLEDSARPVLGQAPGEEGVHRLLDFGFRQRQDRFPVAGLVAGVQQAVHGQGVHIGCAQLFFQEATEDTAFPGGEVKVGHGGIIPQLATALASDPSLNGLGFSRIIDDNHIANSVKPSY